MKRKIIILIVNILLLSVYNINAQQIKSASDTNLIEYVSPVIYHLHPVLLAKRHFLFSFQTVLPNYFKALNPKTGDVEKLSSKVVLNEAYFNGYVTYGLSDRWNIHLFLPVLDIHHYSPMIFKSGVGLGDIKTGISYQIIDLQKDKKNALSADLTFGFPTGRYKNLNTDEYPLGLGSFRFKGAITGMHLCNNLNIIYSAYYEFRTNRLGVQMGDETGAYLIMKRTFPTKVGHFGLEGGTYSYWNFSDKKSGKTVPNSSDYAIDLYVGANYMYLNKFNLRIGVPYSIYQNGAWLTKYQVFLQIDYRL